MKVKFMFKKSDNKGDRTPKPASKEDAVKTTPAALATPAPAKTDATAALTTPAAAKIDAPATVVPANEAQKS